MASPRALSPMDSTPSSPSQLTPRSKVKGLLAALDDKSDVEKDLPPSRPDRSELDWLINFHYNQIETRIQSSIGQMNGAESSEEQEDEEVVFRPRGRLAGRMLALHADVE